MVIATDIPSLARARRFAVAPMMDCTDRHCRFLLRLISRHVLLYTEMVTAAAIVRGRDARRLLAFDPTEQPVALQLGGSDPRELAIAARCGAEMGYSEINLNVGCPSDRVTAGRFGACLMAEPDLVAACVAAMAAATDVPVTVKTRIGIARRGGRNGASATQPAALEALVNACVAVGCTTFIVHARDAWLDGLSPKENREIPPLDYGRVFDLKQRMPHLTVALNGGLRSLDAVDDALKIVDGVMLGRAIAEQPYLLAEVDRRIFADSAVPPTRSAVTAAYAAYADREIAEGARQSHVLRHLNGLFHGAPGARRWRQAVARSCQEGDPVSGLVSLAQALEAPEALAA